MSGNQNDEESAAEETGAGAAAPTKEVQREKSTSKVVRVLTVFAYLFSVSFAAILLSVYYVCIWKSPDAHETQGHVSARRAEFHPMFTEDAFNYTGRSNTSMNEFGDHSRTDNITGILNDTLSLAEDWILNSTLHVNSTSQDPNAFSTTNVT